MKAIVFFAIASAAAALPVQEVVDNLFGIHLPQNATWTWEEVKACRGKCLGPSLYLKDAACIAACPVFQSPFQRIAKQCDVFNLFISSADAKACHHRCGHDFACHFECPRSKPTTIKELEMTSQAMVCLMKCGVDQECHKACSNPWAEKQAQCEKLHAFVMCHHSGGSHPTCPDLHVDTKTELMQEPWIFVKDIGNHVADYLAPLLGSQEVSVEGVRACHMRCGDDHACHKRCPKGVFGRFQDKCDTLEEASTCHKTCEHSEIKCPFKKMECHHKCPMSMPTSVKEFKGLMDHVLCHSSCGKDKMCHKTCPNSNWNEKMSQCKQYDEMVACHKGCARDHTCHASCPRLNDQILNDITQKPTSIVKSVLDALVV